MESICGTPRPFHLPLSSRPAFLKPFSPISFKPPPLKPSSPKTLTPLRASHKPSNPSPSSSPQTLQTLSSLLKPTFIAAAAAVAVFLSRHHKPSLAAAVPISPPAAQSETLPETLTEEEKEKTLEDHLLSNPKDITSLRTLMELKVKFRKLPEAISIVDRLILLEPGENDLPLLKAHLQSYSGESESAKLGFEEIISKDPFLVEAYHGLVMSASQSGADGDLGGILKRVEGAMKMCEKERRKEELRDFKLLVAQVRVIEGKYEKALKVYQELVKEEPRDFRPYLCQGIIYTLMRKQDEAEQQFEKYQKLVPKGHPYAQFFDHNMSAMKGFIPNGVEEKAF